MRKYIVLLLLSIVGIGASVFLVRQSSSSTESEYRQAVKAYQIISISELEEKLDRQDDFILYIGRETCPYCRAFVPKLTQAVEETGKTVFYLDSENDPDGKIHLLMDFTDHPGDIDDPWYSGDFTTAYRQISEGCQGLLKYLISQNREKIKWNL